MASRQTAAHRFLAVLIVAFAVNASASVKAAGTFEAVRSCEAYRSFQKGTNPGFVRLEPGHTYAVEEINERDWDWIRLNIPEAQEPMRWVSRECGVAELTSLPPQEDDAAGRKGCRVANTYDSNVLAMSWQPGFCEHASYSGRKPECDALEDGELVISHLTIHGLWPNKTGCRPGAYANCRRVTLELSEDTRSEVAPWMPNLIYETELAEHEWDKHGTCQVREDDEYFRAMKDLTALVDRSAIGEYIQAHVGKQMSVNGFFAHVRRELGPDVEQRLQVLCARGRYLQEIRLNLPREPMATPDITKMVAGAPQVRTRVDKCDSDSIYIEAPGRD